MPKKSAPAKASKKSVSKKRFILPKLNARTYSIGLVVLVLLSVATAYGTRAWKSNQLTAKAAGWTNLSIQTYMKPYYTSAKVCKVSETGAYGPVWKYNLQVWRTKANDPNGNYISAAILRNDSFWLPTVKNSQWLYGVVAGVSVYGSKLNDDQVQFGAGGGLLGNSLYRPAQILDC